MLLLFENQVRARDSGRSDEDERRYLFLARSSEHRHRSPLAVSRDRDSSWIDVFAFRKPLHDRDQIVGVVLQGDAFTAPAALSNAAFVVSKDEEPVLRETPRELREDWHAGRDFVAVDRSRTGDEHNDGQTKLPHRRR